MSRGEQQGRDLRVPGEVGALIRLGLAEIVQRVATSTPLTTAQAVEHVEYELDVLRKTFASQAKVAEGKKS
jgi:hypothetical protein